MPATSALKRILIVDDEAIVAFFLMEGLKELDTQYDVRTAGSAESALELVDRTSFDLAVIDCRLPGSSGLDLIQTLQKASPQTQTILITAYGSPEVEEQARHLQARYYLEKPFPIQELLLAVRQVLP